MVAGYHFVTAAGRTPAATNRSENARKLPLILQPRSPALLEGGRGGQWHDGNRMEWPWIGLLRPGGTGVYRLPGRIRDLQRRHPPSQDRQGGGGSAPADASLKPGAPLSTARLDLPNPGCISARLTSELLLLLRRDRR